MGQRWVIVAGLGTLVVLVAALIVARASSSDESPTAVPLAPVVTTVTEPAASSSGETSSLADRIQPLESAVDIPPLRSGPQPVAISFSSIGVDGSPIDGVGVEPNGELEVPGPLRVGWYEFGPRPGEPGSTVLAAHIASDGIDGVFRHLADAEVGEEFELTLDDGTTSRYRIIELAQYDKDDLPLDRVFARSGSSVVTLITCGGAFQPSIRSYEDNVVAYAVPV